ncbi:hypothetical protein EVAR_66242_1, partial [Eumeta japonica]
MSQRRPHVRSLPSLMTRATGWKLKGAMSMGGGHLG